VNLKPGMPVADILDILKITKQSLARVLRQLIDHGYVEQKTGNADRRQRLLYATDKGRKFFEVLSATQTSRIDAAIASLPPDGKRTVLKFFVGMVEPGDRPTLDRLKLTEDLPQK
jgi:DNA-binding MarR family transcriptional regulator